VILINKDHAKLSDLSSPGLEQAGLASTIAYSISLLPEDLQGMFWANIGLIGGSTKFPGFRERLYVNIQYSIFATITDGANRLEELQPVAPAGCEVVIYSSEEYVVFC
jgi:actin-related protein 6